MSVPAVCAIQVLPQRSLSAATVEVAGTFNTAPVTFKGGSPYAKTDNPTFVSACLLLAVFAYWVDPGTEYAFERRLSGQTHRG